MFSRKFEISWNEHDLATNYAVTHSVGWDKLSLFLFRMIKNHPEVAVDLNSSKNLDLQKQKIFYIILLYNIINVFIILR